MKKISKNLSSAIKASIEAGKKILEVYLSENFELEFKDDDSPLTKADLMSNDAILSILKSESSIPILSEEGSKIDYSIRKNWKKLWIVDPLDGTKEFVKRNGEFTVNIALIENHIPVLGVIFVPVSGDLFFSEKNIGSYKINLSNFSFDPETLIEKSDKLPIYKSTKNSKSIIAESLEFKKVDEKKFPLIKLKNKIIEYPSTAIIINAANEVLVSEFLKKKIPYMNINKQILSIMNDSNYKKYAIKKPKTLKEIFKIDSWAKATINKKI